MMCLGVGPFESISFGTFCTSWICVFSFTRRGKFWTLFLQVSSWSHAHSLLLRVFPWCRCSYALCCPKGFLSSHFFSFFFLFLRCLCVLFYLVFPIIDLILHFIQPMFIPSNILFISDNCIIYFLKYILLIMLLYSTHFLSPLYSPPPCTPSPTIIPPP